MNTNFILKQPELVSPLPNSELELRLLEEAYCSHGDTVHYAQEPSFFEIVRRLVPLRQQGYAVP